MMEAADGAILDKEGTSKNASGRIPVTSMNPTVQAGTASVADPHSLAGSGLRHELVDAQVEVLCSYLDKRSPEQLVAALDRLIDCCRASFREEEGLMERLGGQTDPAHRERHETVMDQLQRLRLTALDFDRGHLLGSLILIDRELIAHVADAARAQGNESPPALVSFPPQVEAHY